MIFQNQAHEWPNWGLLAQGVYVAVRSVPKETPEGNYSQQWSNL